MILLSAGFTNLCKGLLDLIVSQLNLQFIFIDEIKLKHFTYDILILSYSENYVEA